MSQDSRNTRLIFGLQHGREALLRHGANLTVYIENKAGDRHQLDAFAQYASSRGAFVERVHRSRLDQLAQGERHQGVAVLAPSLHVFDLQWLLKERPQRVMILDELTDPHNFGAIVRSSVAFGVGAVLWPEDKSAPLSASMGRASAGAVEHAQLVRVPSLPLALQALTEHGYFVVGLDMNGQSFLHQLSFGEHVALVVGAEGKGLRRPVKQACSVLAKIPMPGGLGSLNASVAASISLYEVTRQQSAS